MTDSSHTHPIDLDGRSILITGGTGSFGRRFVRRVLDAARPERLVILSRDEHKQYDMQQEFADHLPRLRFFIGDVRDRDRLTMAMRGIDYVVHAAALKHVPIAEYNPFECINTNVIGAENVVQAAINNDVQRVIALSTDKAANPINLYGASKLASDKIMVAANALSARVGTRFAVVRYGNVIGSRGGVVPLFRRLIAEGAASLPITDARMTRFWITLDQGIDFVLSSLAMMEGGEVFVPKIPSMKITDLARHMAPDLPQREIGIRPGEKLHELMITSDDSRSTVEMADRYIIEPAFPSWQRTGYEVRGGRRVADGFSYASDSNDDWLDGARLGRLLADSGFGGTAG
ncbi:MAG: UDP-N-acetylglucosamine 4,6-dehydratase (inverting) [Alphaproteobacteria bacterium]|nr:UDP-N-acetylglucosamine 4,6-dehydratase (inverting) [Alphaproteobacteria bacterium]